MTRAAAKARASAGCVVVAGGVVVSGTILVDATDGVVRGPPVVAVGVDSRVGSITDAAVVWAVDALGSAAGSPVGVDGVLDLVDDGRHGRSESQLCLVCIGGYHEFVAVRLICVGEIVDYGGSGSIERNNHQEYEDPSSYIPPHCAAWFQGRY